MLVEPVTLLCSAVYEVLGRCSVADVSCSILDSVNGEELCGT